MKHHTATHYLLEARLLRENVESFEKYPFSIPVVRHLDSIEFHHAVTFIIGENGSGKSTLVEALAIGMGLNPESGTSNFKFSTRASHSTLHKSLRLSKGVQRPKNSFFLRAESVFNLATEIERLDSEPSFGPPIINSYGGRSLHEQSHGESFFAMLMNRFGSRGLYILDEPEAALSPTRQMAMLARMHELVVDQSQFIIATHSPILLAYPNAKILQISQEGLQKVDYRDTEHYRVTRDFLNNPDKALRLLLTAY